MTNAVAVNRDIRCCRRVQPTCGLTPDTGGWGGFRGPGLYFWNQLGTMSVTFSGKLWVRRGAPPFSLALVYFSNFFRQYLSGPLWGAPGITPFGFPLLYIPQQNLDAGRRLDRRVRMGFHARRPYVLRNALRHGLGDRRLYWGPRPPPKKNKKNTQKTTIIILKNKYI